MIETSCSWATTVLYVFYIDMRPVLSLDDWEYLSRDQTYKIVLAAGYLIDLQYFYLCARYGQLSGMVEPIAGMIGALAVTICEPVLPYALAFAAGAMIFVVVDDIIPEAQTG